MVMVFVFLVDFIGTNSSCSILQPHEVTQKFLGERCNVLARVFSHQQRLTLVGLRGHVTLETIHILVSALLLTHLAVPL